MSEDPDAVSHFADDIHDTRQKRQNSNFPRISVLQSNKLLKYSLSELSSRSHCVAVGRKHAAGQRTSRPGPTFNLASCGGQPVAR